MGTASVCVAALVLGIPSLGLAQQPSAAAQDEGTLEEIVITAEKRPEKLQDVPVSAAVVSTESLRQSNVSDISDINNLVPSVNMNGTINGRVPVGLRGISTVSDEQTVGISSGVAVMIDGVPVPSDSQGGNQIEDAQSIEVLKGPQATLGGRTAAAGVINILTRGPSDHFQGSLDGTVTDDGEYRLSGFVAGPISDRIQFSLSAYDGKRKFPITNTFYDTKTRQDDYGVRAKLLFKITDDIDLTLAGRNARTRSEGYNFVYTYITPGATLLFPGSPLTQGRLLPGITLNNSNLSYDSPVTGAGHRHDDNDASAILDFHLPGGYTLTSTSAYQHENQHQTQDLFAVGVYFLDSLVATFSSPTFTWTPVTSDPHIFNDLQDQWEYIRQKSEEIKLVSPVDQPVSFVTGLFYSDTSVHELLSRKLAPAMVDVDITPDTATYDIYGRGTWKFTEANSLLVGLRYNIDQLKYSYPESEQAIGTNADGTPHVFGPFSSYGSSRSSALVGDLSLQHQFTSDVMGYATYARGYAPKVYNTSAVLYSANQVLEPVAQEHVDHFEIGTKGTYFDRRMTIDAAVFDTIYKPYQLQVYSNVPGAVTPPLDLVALGKAETRGAELDVDWAATNLWRLNFDAAYIDAKFLDYHGAPCYPTQTTAEGCVSTVVNGLTTLVQDASGKPMPNSPKFKGVLGVQRRIPWINSMEFVLGGSYAYRTSAVMLPDQNPHAIQGGFGLLNLNIGLHGASDQWAATLFVNNVTNHVYYVDVEDFFTGPWSSQNAVIAQPARDAQRYAGLHLSYQFK